MEQQQIKVFIDAMSASDLDEMEFSQDGWKLRLTRRAASRRPAPLGRTAGFASPLGATTNETPGVVLSEGTSSEPATATTLQTPAQAPLDPAGRSERSLSPEDLIAPLYGVVHLRQAPGEPPLASPGQAVTAGQTLCLIEAMKTFVEVRAEAGGTVAELLVESGQEVDAGQVLLRFA